MIVTMRTSVVWYGREYHDGDQIDLPEELAAKYVAAGSAEFPEPPVETAALHTQPPKGRKDGRNTTGRTQPRTH